MLYNNGGNSWYMSPTTPYASSVIFRDASYPDTVANVHTALTFLMTELRNIVVQGAGGIDDNTISTLSTWSSTKINDMFVAQVAGKDLSTNDFTDYYKNQLDLMAGYTTDMAYLRSLAHDHANKAVLDSITLAKIAYWDNKSNFSGSYLDLTDKPDLSNLTLYATKDWVQTYHENNTYDTLSLYPDYSDLVRKDELDLLNDNLTYAKKQWVLDQIASKNDFTLVKVDHLPTEAEVGAANIDTNKIYLLQTNVNPDLYEKWLNVNGCDDGWTLLSTSLMDLTNYYDKTEIDAFRAIDTQAQNISIADVAGLFASSNVEGALKELMVGLNNIDVSKYAEKDDLANVAFTGNYEDIIDKPIDVLTGETLTPIIWSEVPAGIYFAKGAQKVLSQSAETPDVICYGTTEIYHYNDGIGNRVTTAFTSKLLGGQFKPCTVIMTYPDTLIGTPTVEYYYYPNTNEVLTKDNITPYTPVDDYNPATKKYVDDAVADKDLSNYLAKDNTTVYTPTDDYNPATKKYVDDTIPRNVSELNNDLDYLKRAELVSELDGYQYIKRSVVTALPAPADAKTNVIYMILNADGEYDKYVYTGSANGNNGFEPLGGGGVDEIEVKRFLFELQADGVTPDETLPLYVPVDEVTIHEKAEVETWTNTSADIMQSYLDLIDDTQMALLKTWSSVKINTELFNTLNDGKAYTDYIASVINRPQYEHVTSLDEMIQTDRFYLLENPVGSGKFDMYIVNANDGTKTCIGNTEVDLREYQKIEDTTLGTLDKTVPGAINELLVKIGGLNNLTTLANTNVVNAINELDGDIGNLPNLTTDNKTDLVTAINEHETQIGELSNLKTTAKDNLVNSMNEIYQNITPIGTVLSYAGSTAPTGYLICDGSSLLQADYPELFAVIGTTYGSVDADHFNLPNLFGKLITGLDPADPDFDTLGNTGGEKTHTLTVDEMPSHTHTFTGTSHTHTFTGIGHSHSLTSGAISASSTASPNGSSNYVPVCRTLSSSCNDGGYDNMRLYNDSGSYITVGDVDWLQQDSNTVTGTTSTTAGGTNANTTATGTNSSVGGEGSHNNLQPYIVMQYIIRVK